MAGKRSCFLSPPYEKRYGERDSKRRRTGSITRYTISLEKEQQGENRPEITNVKVPDGENSAVSQDRMPGSGIVRLEMSKQRGEVATECPKLRCQGK